MTAPDDLRALSDLELELCAYRALVEADPKSHETWMAISRLWETVPPLAALAGWLLALNLAPQLPWLVAAGVPLALMVPLAVLGFRRHRKCSELVARERLALDAPERLAVVAEIARRSSEGRALH